jgi:hypothetical protein
MTRQTPTPPRIDGVLHQLKHIDIRIRAGPARFRYDAPEGVIDEHPLGRFCVKLARGGV